MRFGSQGIIPAAMERPATTAAKRGPMPKPKAMRSKTRTCRCMTISGCSAAFVATRYASRAARRSLAPSSTFASPGCASFQPRVIGGAQCSLNRTQYHQGRQGGTNESGAHTRQSRRRRENHSGPRKLWGDRGRTWPAAARRNSPTGCRAVQAGLRRENSFAYGNRESCR